jgi:threonine dehydrogenase-like Zn-dependent dehydrogenase
VRDRPAHRRRRLPARAVPARAGARVRRRGRRAGRAPRRERDGESTEALDRRFGVAIDATGAPGAIEAAFDGLDRGGRLLVFGVAAGDATIALSPFRIYNDEITVLGSMAVLHSFAPALELVAAGAIEVDAMLTHDFPLDGFADALATVRAGEGVKSQVLPDGAIPR